MKKQLKKVIAMTLVCAMTLPTAVFASTAPSLSGNTPGTSVSDPDTTISGDSTVDTADYKVIVPSNLDFAVDRFEVSDKGQIYGVDYPIINAGAFAVKVDVTVSNNSTAATLVDDETDAKLSSTSAGDLKTAYIAAYVPKSINVAADAITAVDGDTVSGNWASVSDNTVIAVGATTPAKFGFKLAKYDDTAVSTNNCATFSWTGKVNSNGEWQNGDVKVKAAFKFSGLSRDGYNALQSVSDNNLLAGDGGGSVKTISKANPQNIIFDLSSYNRAAVTSVVFKGTGSNTQTRTLGTPAGYAFDGTTKKLTIKGATGAFVSGFPVDTYTVTVTFGDKSTAQVTLKLAN